MITKGGVFNLKQNKSSKMGWEFRESIELDSSRSKTKLFPQNSGADWKWLIVVLFLLSFMTCCFCAEEKSAEEKAKGRFEKLLKEASNQTLSKFDSTRLKTYVTNPHNYSLFIFFTGEDARLNCHTCKPIEKTFLATLQIFHQQSTWSSSRFMKTPFFFGICDVHDCYDIFIKANWNSIPKIVYIPPKTGRNSLDFEGWQELDLNELPTIESIANFVSKKTGYPNIFEKGAVEIYSVYVLGLVSLCILLYTVYSKLRNPMFWFMLSMGVFAVSMSGLVFNSINKPPWNYRNPYTGQVLFIYPSPRQQFESEGLLMAGLLTGISLVIIGFVHYVPSFKGSFQRRGVFFVLVCLFLTFYVVIWRIFHVKHGYYPFAF